MTTWIVIVAVGLGSYVLRALPVALGGRWATSARAERAIAHAGTAALAALVVGGLRRDAASGDASEIVPIVLAVVAALVVAVRGSSLPRVLLAGAAVHVVAVGCAVLVT